MCCQDGGLDAVDDSCEYEDVGGYGGSDGGRDGSGEDVGSGSHEQTIARLKDEVMKKDIDLVAKVRCVFHRVCTSICCGQTNCNMVTRAE